jgi:GT2 family glycosyltransferase
MSASERPSIRPSINRKRPFLAVLNDDAVAHPGWLEALLPPLSRAPTSACAPRKSGSRSGGSLDSAGMLLCLDGSSKQRGHLESPASYARQEEALLPSGSAALYRREMLDEIGLFDESFFLYCEDTDLGFARAGPAGNACTFPMRWWNIAIRIPRARPPRSKRTMWSAIASS